MARRKDVAVEEVRKVRRKMSARLWKAREEGRYLEELRVLGRRGRRALSTAGSNGRNANGRTRK